MKKTILRNYARLIARKGVNIQKGQDVFITCGLDQPAFVEILVDECYKAGAGRVVVDWEHQPLAKLNYRYRSLKSLSSMTNYEEARWQYYVDNIPCRIYLESDDPDGLKGVNQQKMQTAMQRRYPAVKKYRDQIENKYQWCIAGVPGEAWAKKLFPELTKHQAVEKLWEKILETSRALEGDPVENWEKHNKDLQKRCDYLNSLDIDELYYRSSNGTDFRVGLIKDSVFEGGCGTSLQGIVYNPNIPSEECFTSPMKGKAEGIVYATKPLSYQGQLIEDFWIRFKDGKAVEWGAKKNQELLTKMIGMDEGAAYLGECALVPFDSPIQNSGILFYSTLYDENAACHLALGRGFEECLKGYENMTLDECHEKGINTSMIHVDFMIGSEDLDITAKTRSGKEVAVFRNGNWAF